MAANVGAKRRPRHHPPESKAGNCRDSADENTSRQFVSLDGANASHDQTRGPAGDAMCAVVIPAAQIPSDDIGRL